MLLVCLEALEKQWSTLKAAEVPALLGGRRVNRLRDVGLAKQIHQKSPDLTN